MDDRCCTDVIEVMFLCQVAAVASSAADQCSSVNRRRSFYDQLRNGTIQPLSPDLILLRFKAVDMFLCIDANDARVRLKRIVSNLIFVLRRVSDAVLR